MNKLEKIRRILDLPNYPIKGTIKGLAKTDKVLVYKNDYGFVKVNNCFWGFNTDVEGNGDLFLEVYQAHLNIEHEKYLKLDLVKTLAINKELNK